MEFEEPYQRVGNPRESHLICARENSTTRKVKECTIPRVKQIENTVSPRCKHHLISAYPL